MSIELKIKSKHLALEAKVIRFEETKVKKQLKWLSKNKPTEVYAAQLGLNSLSEHRKHVVGRENRATFLARAYIAGKSYNYVEAGKRKERKHYEFNTYVLPRVLEMVKKYHHDFKVRRSITIEELIDWSSQ